MGKWEYEKNDRKCKKLALWIGERGAFYLRKKMRQIGADGFTGEVEFVIF
jgi:hypothetical protein